MKGGPSNGIVYHVDPVVLVIVECSIGHPKYVSMDLLKVANVPSSSLSDSFSLFNTSVGLERVSTFDTLNSVSSFEDDRPLYHAARSIFRSMNYALLHRIAYMNITTLQPVSVKDKDAMGDKDVLTLLKGNVMNKKLIYGVTEATDLIGRGISGAVYKGFNLAVGTPVALKKSKRLGSFEEKCAEKMDLLLSDDIPEYTTSGTVWLPLKYVPFSRRLGHVLQQVNNTLSLIDLYSKAKTQLDLLHSHDYCHGDAHVGNFLVVDPTHYPEPHMYQWDITIHEGDVIAIDFDQCFKCTRTKDKVRDVQVLIAGIERTIMTSILQHTPRAGDLMEVLHAEKKRLKRLERE